jgi:hypothetical protein
MKLKGKIPLGRRSHRWDNIKIHFRELKLMWIGFNRFSMSPVVDFCEQDDEP